MKPSEIQSLLTQSKACFEHSPGGIHTFALYWITWEAYRTRLLAVATRLRGWRIEDAYFAIGAKHISGQKAYKKCFKDITTVELSNQTGLLGRIWNQVDDIQVLRNRLIHGYRSADPEFIQQANLFLDSILSHQNKVFSNLTLPLQDGRAVKLGNVLTQRPAAGRKIAICGGRESLLNCLNMKQAETPPKFIDRAILPRLAKTVEELK